VSTGESELELQLRQLEEEERLVSARRRALHERLANFPNELAVQQEQALSARRRELHAAIDELRIRIRTSKQG
jgi:hypothetical protein